MTDPVLRQKQGHIGIITLNRPDARNAIDAATSLGLSEALDWLDAEDDLRVGVLAANGPSFCAGMDLKTFAAGQAGPIFEVPGGFGGIVRRNRRKPLIAAVDGPALAGGFEIALACDMMVASPNARFGLPEVTLGLIAGAGGVFRIADRLPYAIAAEILLTGRAITYDEALNMGLVSRPAEPGQALDQALTLAGQIAALAPLAVQATLELLRAQRQAQEKASWQENDRLFEVIAGSADAHEGATAFAEKRKPQWQGR